MSENDEIEFDLEDSQNDGEDGGEGEDTGADGKPKVFTDEELLKLPPEKLVEMNKKLFSRAKNAEGKLKIAKPAEKKPIINKPNQNNASDDLTKTVGELKLAEDKRQFGYEHGLSPAETDLAFKFAGGIPTKESLADEDFKAMLTSRRSRERLNNNTPRPTNKSFIAPGKKMSELKPNEKQDVFEKKMDVALKRR